MKVAMEVKEEGLKVAATPKVKPELIPPAELIEALNKNPQAKEGYESLSPSHKREYLVWILDAKTPETRNKRIDQTVEQVKEKKSKNWKYQN